MENDLQDVSTDGKSPAEPEHVTPPARPMAVSIETAYTSSTPPSAPAVARKLTIPGMGTIDKEGLRQLLDSYKNALTKPKVETYAAEAAKAEWWKVLVGVGAVALLAAIVPLLRLNSALSGLLGNFGLYQGLPGNVTFGLGITMFVVVLSAFFVGAVLLLLVSLPLGAKGEGRDFLTHCYLLSLSHVPIRLVFWLLLLFLPLGSFRLLWWVQMFAQLYFASLALEAAHSMQANKARMAAFIPAGALFLLSLFF